MKKELRERTWHVYKINCDCASYTTTRRRMASSGQLIRCDYCHKQLGDMEVNFWGTYKVKTPSEAIELGHQESMKRAKAMEEARKRS